MSWALQRVVPREPHKSKAVPLSKSLKSSRTQVWLISKFKQSSLVPHCTNDKTTQKTAQTLDEAPCRPSPSPHRRNRPTSGPQSCAMVGQAQLKSTSELYSNCWWDPPSDDKAHRRKPVPHGQPLLLCGGTSDLELFQRWSCGSISPYISTRIPGMLEFARSLQKPNP